MAFTIENWGSISAQSDWIWVGFQFGAGESRGAVFAEAFPQSGGAELVSFDTEIDNSNGAISYWFKLKNTGSQPTSFTLLGGGVV